MDAITKVKKPRHWLSNEMWHAPNAMLPASNAMLPTPNAILQPTNAMCTKVKTNKVETNITPLPHWFIVSMARNCQRETVSANPSAVETSWQSCGFARPGCRKTKKLSFQPPALLSIPAHGLAEGMPVARVNNCQRETVSATRTPTPCHVTDLGLLFLNSFSCTKQQPTWCRKSKI